MVANGSWSQDPVPLKACREEELMHMKYVLTEWPHDGRLYGFQGRRLDQYCYGDLISSANLHENVCINCWMFASNSSYDESVRHLITNILRPLWEL
ncbi:hypothetical protein TNCV_3888831 [Trichonephila clavipes]|nr:hypothetical protein TNCV_3888831 [Trichonephila clavipes]